MGNNYLQTFRSSLPLYQGNQILKLLTSRKDSGEIRTIDEFKSQLATLTQQLQNSQSGSTLSLYLGIVGQIISSEQYNFMLDRISDDLSSAFAEADTLDEILEDHHQLLDNVALKSIHLALNDLEAKISLSEFLNQDTNGFDNAIYEKFNASNIASISRANPSTTFTYIDPRSKDFVGSAEDAFIDSVGGSLILGSPSGDIKIVSATWLSNTNSVRSDIDASFKTTTINNIIDGQMNTFWISPFLFTETKPGGIPMEISLFLGKAQSVNYLRIEPASPYPFSLVQVDYLDTSETRQTVLATSLAIDRDTRVDFAPVITDTLILRFVQYNYEEVQFYKDVSSNEYVLAVNGESASSPDVASITPYLQQTLSSDFILSDIYNTTNEVDIGQKYFEYILGFDNLFVGSSPYNERGIFVSPPLKGESPGLVGIRVSEYRPAQLNPGGPVVLVPTVQTDVPLYLGSIEYWLEAQLYTADNLLQKTVTVPVLPLGVSRIYHERLVLSERDSATNNIGQLCFYTDAVAYDGTHLDGVRVYRNGLEIAYGLDWIFVPVGNGITVETPNSGLGPMKRGIKIPGSPSPLDIFTATYTPTISNTRSSSSLGSSVIVDMTGDNSMRLVTGNLIIFDKSQLPFDTAYAIFYLTTILRHNSSAEGVTPLLKEYLLLTSSVDTQKFA